jgi:hypothetical protein
MSTGADPPRILALTVADSIDVDDAGGGAKGRIVRGSVLLEFHQVKFQTEETAPQLPHCTHVLLIWTNGLYARGLNPCACIIISIGSPTAEAGAEEPTSWMRLLTDPVNLVLIFATPGLDPPWIRLLPACLDASLHPGAGIRGERAWRDSMAADRPDAEAPHSPRCTFVKSRLNIHHR